MRIITSCTIGLLALLFTTQLFAQDTISVKEIYFNKYLSYKTSNDQLFSGVAQKLRKNGNGHIVSEEIYEMGVILEWRSYFGRSKRRLAENVLYYKEAPLTPKEKIQYRTNKHGNFIERTYFDLNQKKTLNTIHRDTTLTYRMPYLNGKKHGEEFCYDDEGNPLVTEYVNGKKVKK